MHPVLAVIAAVFVACVGFAAASPAAAQKRAENCAAPVEKTESIRRDGERFRSGYMVYRNICDRPITVHHCETPSSDRFTCNKAAMFGSDFLDIGQSVEVRRNSGGAAYFHVIVCEGRTRLVDLPSKVTGRSNPTCENEMASAPPPGSGPSFAGVGEKPDPSAPIVTLKSNQLFLPADYPAALRGSGAEGRVIVTFAVDAEGRATGCWVTQSSGYAALDEVTCKLAMRRARFVPATDENGNGIPGRYPEFKAGWGRQ